MAKKKVSRKGASKAAPKKPIMILSQVEEKELILDTKTIEKLDDILSKNGSAESGLTRSDIVAHLLFEIGLKGFEFSPAKNENVNEKISLPKSAWVIAEKSAERSGGIELSEVVKKLVSKQ